MPEAIKRAVVAHSADSISQSSCLGLKVRVVLLILIMANIIIFNADGHSELIVKK